MRVISAFRISTENIKFPIFCLNWTCLNYILVSHTAEYKKHYIQTQILYYLK